jgi:hypothetical protein
VIRFGIRSTKGWNLLVHDRWSSIRAAIRSEVTISLHYTHQILTVLRHYESYIYPKTEVLINHSTLRLKFKIKQNSAARPNLFLMKF